MTGVDVAESIMISVIIPALNEESSIAAVLRSIPETASEVIVVDNNSNDSTAHIAASEGATVLFEPMRGYGSACQKGIAYLQQKSIPPDIVVFMDADFSDLPSELNEIVAPILSEGFDMVIGSRTIGNAERGAITVQQKVGNWLATRIIYWRWKFQYTDLGPFRAIRFQSLMNLNMRDETYGWTVEMQIKALINKLKIKEVPVTYRKRIGVSKISGTIKGSILAGYKIIKTIIKYF